MSRWGGTDQSNLVAEIPDGTLSEATQLLIRIGKLTQLQVARVAATQKKRGISFAAAAVELGFLRREDLMSVLSRQYSYPILSADPDNTRFSGELVVGHEPFGPAAEAIRSIRTSIVSSAIAQGTRSIVVTGPRRGSGATYLAGNIALAFAQMAVPTLLVDADLRNPRIAEMFGVSGNEDGLSNALRRRDIINVSIVSDIVPGLSILTAGAIAPNPQELLCSAEFIALANNLEKDFGVVIYDTSAAMEYADASVVVSRVGAAIIVARQHATNFNDVSTLAHKFRANQCKFLGTVLNNF